MASSLADLAGIGANDAWLARRRETRPARLAQARLTLFETGAGDAHVTFRELAQRIHSMGDGELVLDSELKLVCLQFNAVCGDINKLCELKQLLAFMDVAVDEAEPWSPAAVERPLLSMREVALTGARAAGQDALAIALSFDTVLLPGDLQSALNTTVATLAPRSYKLEAWHLALRVVEKGPGEGARITATVIDVLRQDLQLPLQGLVKVVHVSTDGERKMLGPWGGAVTLLRAHCKRIGRTQCVMHAIQVAAKLVDKFPGFAAVRRLFVRLHEFVENPFHTFHAQTPQRLARWLTLWEDLGQLVRHFPGLLDWLWGLTSDAAVSEAVRLRAAVLRADMLEARTLLAAHVMWPLINGLAILTRQLMTADMTLERAQKLVQDQLLRSATQYGVDRDYSAGFGGSAPIQLKVWTGFEAVFQQPAAQQPASAGQLFSVGAGAVAIAGQAPRFQRHDLWLTGAADDLLVDAEHNIRETARSVLRKAAASCLSDSLLGAFRLFRPASWVVQTGSDTPEQFEVLLDSVSELKAAYCSEAGDDNGLPTAQALDTEWLFFSRWMAARAAAGQLEATACWAEAAASSAAQQGMPAWISMASVALTEQPTSREDDAYMAHCKSVARTHKGEIKPELLDALCLTARHGPKLCAPLAR